MKKFRKFLALLMLAALPLSGCARKEPVETRIETVPVTTAAPETTAETTAETKPAPDLSGNGDEITFGSAKSMLLYDVDNGTVVCSREPDAPMAPGSLTKMVTALIAIENCNLDDVVTVGSISGWNLPAGALNQKLRPTEQLTVRDLLACVILYSANDAAMVLSEHVAGSQEAFVARMNERVREMGCTDTEFADAHGLDAEKNRTTARDLLRITLEAIQNDTFRELFGMPTYVVPATNCSDQRELDTQNYMMSDRILYEFYDPRVTGGMQAYSKDNGAGLVCTVEDDGLYIGIVLGAERIFKEDGWRLESFGNYEDMAELLNQGIQN